ncbi:MAG: cupin domain-containing protein [Candidatus Brocadiaceae bacterium]|nr:cupin domain-containing protein [Candidatus Brocadiaceae bacterium]
MEKVNAEELDYRNSGSGPKYLFRGPRIDWGLIRFLPGQELGPHLHRQVEETFFFTSGTGVFVADGLEYDIRPGDAFRLEPGEVHNVINTGSAPLDGVFIKHIYNPDDKVDVS